MLDNYYYPNDKVKIWSKSYMLLTLCGFFFYLSTYLFLSVNTLYLVQDVGLSFHSASLLMCSFIVGLFLTGIFNSYLIDAYKRKSVCQLSIILFILTTFGFLYTTNITLWYILRVIQGIAFSLVIMTTNSTLVIDVTPSHHRTEANTSFLWISRIGMLVGLAAAPLLNNMFSYIQLIYIVMGLSTLSLILTFPVNVYFHAPLDSPICSLDRFMLPRTFVPVINVMTIAFVLGTIIGYTTDYLFYLFLIVGFLIGYMLIKIKLNTISLRLGFEVGGILMLIGLLMIISTLHLSIYFYYFSVILLGLGLSISLTYILYHFVGLAYHCERGTANNTYVLFGELSILLGYLFENSWTSEGSERICYIDMLVVLCSLIFFELITRNYYNRQAFR